MLETPIKESVNLRNETSVAVFYSSNKAWVRVTHWLYIHDGEPCLLEKYSGNTFWAEDLWKIDSRVHIWYMDGRV